MAWPASTQYLVEALTKTNNVANSIKVSVQRLRNESESGPVNRIRFIQVFHQLVSARNIWSDTSSINGIVQYAKDQFGNQGIDVAAEFTAMVSAASALETWIENNFPVDSGSGALLYQTLDANSGNVVDLQFTSAQTAGFRSVADTFLETID